VTRLSIPYSILLAVVGTGTFESLVQPLRTELDGYIMTLEAKPGCVLYNALSRVYMEKMLATAATLEAKATLFSASNTCLVHHVTDTIKTTVEKWIAIMKQFKLPDQLVAPIDELEVQPMLVRNIEEAKEVLGPLIRHLISVIDHFGERLKTEDVYQKQLELALMIGSLLADKKLQYFKVFFYAIAS
jgi:hypothetical protein